MFVHNESAHMNFDGLPSVLLVPLINQLANLAVPIIWTVGEMENSLELAVQLVYQLL